MIKSYICCFCRGDFNDYGNNPEPIKDMRTGRCCDTCNYKLVILARLKELRIIYEKSS